MERLLRVASPLGLYAEEFDPETRRHLRNFPQAFSHRALIEAAPRMIVPTLAPCVFVKPVLTATAHALSIGDPAHAASPTGGER